MAFLSHFPRTRLLECTQPFSQPIPIQSALSALDVSSRANMDNFFLPRSNWFQAQSRHALSQTRASWRMNLGEKLSILVLFAHNW